MCILFNTIFMTLHDRMKKNEFGYVFANSASLACKIWALVNDWEASLIHNPDHQNAKQVLNAVTLFHKTEKSKKIMCYLNKQNFRVSYLDIWRQSKKWENDVLMERLVQPPHWRESLYIAASIMLMRNPNPYPCIFPTL